MDIPEFHKFLDSFTDESIEEARHCGCNEAWLHGKQTLHKASYDLNRALADLGWEIINALPGPLSRFARRVFR